MNSGVVDVTEKVHLPRDAYCLDIYDMERMTEKQMI